MRNFNSFSPRRTVVLFTQVTALTALLAACASAPPEAGQKMAVAESAVKQAGTVGTFENAATELQVATAKLALARTAFVSKDYVRAQQLAEQAELDARVAEMRAQSERSRKAANESREAAQALNEEIARIKAR